MQENVRAHAVISGRVQGVFFRMETKQAAERCGVFGWVKNRREGTVEAVFEGDKEKVDAVLKWCWQGPPLSSVTDVATKWEEYTGSFSGFDVTY